MPTPNKNEKKSEFLSRCIPILIKEDKPQDQSVAICISMWEEHKKKAAASSEVNGDEILFFDDSLEEKLSEIKNKRNEKS